jgi:hypothetical protein
MCWVLLKSRTEFVQYVSLINTAPCLSSSFRTKSLISRLVRECRHSRMNNISLTLISGGIDAEHERHDHVSILISCLVALMVLNFAQSLCPGSHHLREPLNQLPALALTMPKAAVWPKTDLFDPFFQNLIRRELRSLTNGKDRHGTECHLSVELNSFLAALNMRPYLSRGLDHPESPHTSFSLNGLSSKIRARKTEVSTTLPAHTKCTQGVALNSPRRFPSMGYRSPSIPTLIPARMLRKATWNQRRACPVLHSLMQLTLLQPNHVV